MKRYQVRQFCDRSHRPDCYEVFDSTTSEAASFGMLKKDAILAARKMNERQLT